MRWTVLVALAVLLPGCITERHCPPSYNQLDWVEPGLYASISGAEPVWLKWDPGDGALPWAGTPVWPGQRLLSVTFDLPPPETEQRGIFLVGGPHLVSIGVERDGQLVALADGNVTDLVLRSAFDRILENLTGDGLDVESAWQSFTASKADTGSASVFPLDAEATAFETRPHWHYVVPLVGHLDADRLAERIALPAAVPDAVGQAKAWSKSWSFTYSLPSWTASHDAMASRETPSLRVDAGDHVVVHAGNGAPSEEALRNVARSLLAPLGRETSFPGATSLGSVC